MDVLTPSGVTARMLPSFRARSAVAFAICVGVELSQLLRTPAAGGGAASPNKIGRELKRLAGAASTGVQGSTYTVQGDTSPY